MNCAWHGSLAEAQALAKSNALSAAIHQGFRSVFGGGPSADEIASWGHGLPSVLEQLGSPGRLSPDTHAVIEYRLPFNGQRVDFLLIGQSASKHVAHVVEFKHWQESHPHPTLRHFVSVAGEPRSHPSYQAANYAGKLRYFHSVAHEWDVTCSAVVMDRSPDHHSGLRDGRYATLWTQAPVFLPGETDAFAEYVADRIKAQPTQKDVASFLEGKYSQSRRFLAGLAEFQEEILDQAMDVLASSGWGLSEEQLIVLDEITAAARLGAPVVYLVSGGPGSGKTLLAIHILLAAARAGIRTVLAVRNNRLMASLRFILDEKKIGANGVLKYFSTLPNGRNGVEDREDRIADLLVCDEAQRLALKSDNVLRCAPVTVIIYDESQILNIEEQGTTARLSALAQGRALPCLLRSLPTLHRCRGGAEYVAWVDGLLQDPKTLASMPRLWSPDYAVEVAASHLDLRDRLAALKASAAKVALVAAFTRSSGRNPPKRLEDLGKLRVPELDPPVQWMMDAKTEYVRFWVKSESNDLKGCASIYGSQGFEADHIGLVWGDDLVIRDGRWQVGNPENCYDSAPGATPLAKIMRSRPEEALRLLRNRYRIFLTRGILSTTIYCEDQETQEFLRAALSYPERKAPYC